MTLNLNFCFPGTDACRTKTMAAKGVLVLLLAVFSATALAEQGTIEEIIVTAQKREESLQDVGIAITAFTDAQLRELGIVYSTELAAQTPGVYISGDGGGNQQQFTIRGATQSDFSILAEGPNATYVDEAYQLTHVSQMFAGFDMERVEILKGPQGTLFGRNATGGLVHFLSKGPTREFEGYGDLTYGSYDSVRFEGAVSGPFNETISGRISGFYNRHDAIYENTFTGADLPPTPAFLAAQGRGPLTFNPENQEDLWVEDQWAVRGQLLFEPNDRVSVLLKGHYAFSDPGSPPYQQHATVAVVDDTNGDGVEDQTVDTVFAADVLSSAFLCEQVSINTGTCVNAVFDMDFDGVRPNPGGDFWGYFPSGGTDGKKVKVDHAPPDSNGRKIYGFVGKLIWEMEWARLVAVSSYSEQTKRQALDVDSGPAPQFIVMDEMEYNWFTQELRLEGERERLRWIAGAYYLTGKGKFAQGLADTIGGINVFGGLFFNGFLPGAGPDAFLEATFNAQLETDSYALFGDIDYDLTESLALDIGFRGIIEEKDYIYNNRMYENRRDNRVDGALFGGGTPLRLPAVFGGGIFEFLPPHEESTSDFLWSGKAQLRWQPSSDIMIYGGVNRGVKAGSFNSPLLTTLTADEYGYAEEVLLAYEIGFKSTLFDNRVRWNGAVYYYDYSDYQAFQFIGTSGAVFNVDAVYKGFELELFSRPVENVDVILGFAYIDPEVKDLLVAPNRPRDVEPTFTPEVQFNFLGRYTWPMTVLGGTAAVQVDGNYASSAFHNINNFGTQKMKSYWLGNVRLSWLSADERWEVAGFVNNVGDTHYQNIGFELSAICGCDEASFGRPRWAGVKVRYNFL